jgi:DNA-binding protein HU-beta
MKRYTTDLIRALAKVNRRPQAYYHTALMEILDGIAHELDTGHTLTLTGFGTFYTRLRPASSLKNLATGQRMTVAPRRVAAFRVGELLKKTLMARSRPPAKTKKAHSKTKY